MTTTESELLSECLTLAIDTGHSLRDLLADAERYWEGPGRAVEPRRWRARATACRRLLAAHRPPQVAPLADPPPGVSWESWLAQHNRD